MIPISILPENIGLLHRCINPVKTALDFSDPKGQSGVRAPSGKIGRNDRSIPVHKKTTPLPMPLSALTMATVRSRENEKSSSRKAVLTTTSILRALTAASVDSPMNTGTILMDW